MLKNEQCDQIKILYKLSSLERFIENHALTRMSKKNNNTSTALLENLEKDLKKYTEQLKTAIKKQSCS